MRAAIVRRWRALVIALAAPAGHTARVLPAVGGASLASVGFGLAWLPLGFIAAGAFLLLIDRRMP